MFQKFTEEERLTAKLSGARVPGKQISQFIAEYRGATRLQDHDWQPGVDLRAQALQDALEVLPGFVEHAEVIQRPPAAEVVLRDSYPESGVDEYFQSSAADLGPVVIVEGVGPQDHFGSNV